MKKLLKLLVFAIAVLFVGTSFGAGSELATMDLVANGVEFVKSDAPTLAFAAVAKKELAERELIKHFRHEGTWLARVPSKNQWVGNDVIKLNEIGADPEVLINNNTYPINVSSRTDTSTAIILFNMIPLTQYNR